MSAEMHSSRMPDSQSSTAAMQPSNQVHEPQMASAQLSHSMDKNDPECPMNWPLHRKLYTSLAAWLFAATVVFSLTCYTAGIDFIVVDFNFNPKDNPNYLPTGPISGYSVYLFGIFFAPIYTPHVAERYGRSVMYFTCILLCGVFNLGAGFCQTFAGVAVLRFLAGFTGGPCLVLYEGTFADIWSARTTNTYYAFLGAAQFCGAGLGALAGWYIVGMSGGWRWTQYSSAILCVIALLFGIGMSESYQREIPRRQAKRQGRTLHQEPALSGVTFGEMFRITVLDPIRMNFTDSVSMMCTFILIFNFAVVMQFIITVPVALGTPPPNGAGFTPFQVGQAFTTVVAGAGLAALCVIMIEQVTLPMRLKKGISESASIEYRLIPTMIATILVTASLFWIGSTVANPNFKPIVPIIGSAVFVWGVAMVVFSVVPYLFDVYPPAGTLSALTAAACGRLVFAGALPLVILQFFTAVTPKWALYTFGFISIPIWAIPFVLFRYGPTLRAKSRYSKVAMSAPTYQKAEPHDMETGYRSGS